MRYSRHINRSQRWRALRALVLSRDRHTCRTCGARRRLEVDHVLAVRTHPQLAWDAANLQLLCARCHSQKTLVEMGRVHPSPARDDWRSAVRQLEKAATSIEGTFANA